MNIKAVTPEVLIIPKGYDEKEIHSWIGNGILVNQIYNQSNYITTALYFNKEGNFKSAKVCRFFLNFDQTKTHCSIDVDCSDLVEFVKEIMLKWKE